MAAFFRVGSRRAWVAALGLTCGLGTLYTQHRRAAAEPFALPETMPDTCPRPRTPYGKPKKAPLMTLAAMRKMAADGRLVVSYRGDIYDMTDFTGVRD